MFLFDGLVYDDVSDVSVDDSGTVWAVTCCGISSYDGDKWKTYTSVDASIDLNFNKIKVTDFWDLWLLVVNDIYPYDDKQWTDFSVPDGIDRSDIKVYRYDMHGTIWAGTSTGVYCYENMTWKRVEMLPFMEVMDIAIDRNNDIWVGTSNQGVYRYNGRAWKHFGEEIFRIQSYVYCIPVLAITIGYDGTVYCGTSKGIFHYKDDEWGRYDITERAVNALKTDSNGVIWAGTEDGVFLRDGNTWSSFSGYNGYDKYVGGAVQSIAFAPDGSTWFGAYSGLFRYGPEKKAEVQDVEIMTSEISIKGNYPNPFNQATTIQFTLPEVTCASCIIYNSAGQKVRSITLGSLSTGRNSIIWDGKNDHGMSVSSGIYFVRVYADLHTASHKMLMLR